MKKRIHIIYHIADLDGHTSGTIALKGVRALLKQSQAKTEIVMHGHDYGFDHNPLMAQINDEDTVYMLDVSLPFALMAELNLRTEFYWIDHHKTAMDEMDELGIRGSRTVGVSAARLAWDYFFPERMLPLGVHLISQYDVWDKNNRQHEHNWEEAVMPFQYYWKYRHTLPEIGAKPLLDSLLEVSDDTARGMMRQGKVIYDYQQRQCNTFAATYAHERTVTFSDGHFKKSVKFLCMNSNVRNSIALEGRFDPKKHEAMMLYYWDDKNDQWIVSMYHPDPPETLELGVIAKTQGGGGHAGAAGFQTKSLPWQDRG